jgi:hypothetical protein
LCLGGIAHDDVRAVNVVSLIKLIGKARDGFANYIILEQKFPNAEALSKTM